MNDLATLAHIVTSRGLATLPLFHAPAELGGKESQLVDVLVSGTAPTEVQVVKALYGAATPANKVALRRLKSRVQTKLLNHLYFFNHDDPRHLVSRRHQMACLALLHKGTALYTEGEYVLSQRLLHRGLAEAQAGEFTTYAVQCGRLLATIYAQLVKPQEYARLEPQLQNALRVLHLEEEAEQLYTRSFLRVAGPVKVRTAFLPSMPGIIQQLEGLHRRAKSFNTFWLLYRLRMIHAELQGNFLEIIRLTTAAARQLKQGRLNARRFDLRFNAHMNVVAYVHERQPAKGLRVAREGIALFAPTSSNWFSFQEYHLLLALYGQQYAYAQQLLHEVGLNPALAKLRPAAVERWDLYRGYLHFAAPPPAPRRATPAPQWALVLPDFSRDKQGRNVAILVLQLLNHLRQHHLDEVLVRLERLRKYQQRHLLQDKAQRSRLFLRLLRILVDAGFDAAKARLRGQATLDTLAQTPMPGDAFAEIEIIPYEHLWELALQPPPPGQG